MNIFEAEMVVGNAHSGPAFGQYEKSKGIGMVLGVVASVATMGAATPLLLTGATLASQIAGGVMMAGGVLSGVGAVTGNKKLSKIGGVLSLAGGLGGLASGGFSGLTSVSGVAATAEVPSATTAMASLTESISPTITQAAEAGTLALPGANSAAELSAGASGLGEGLGGAANATAEAAKQGGGGLLNSAANTASGGGGILDKALKFANENKGLMEIGAKGVSGLIGSAMEGNDKQDLIASQAKENDAKSSYYNANAASVAADTKLKEQQQANMANQVIMLSQDDPELQSKIAALTAAGKQYSIIPRIGTPGAASPATRAMQTNPQVPVRQATFSQPTA